ncbi:hypothetical protein NVP1170O_048 [Vibrio phage 1.170.O._10N.261.52.C3]|nr:hypothetical protein NVP1170O_048 [Vibrio phage 1.170.O._10N.261.52.C3]
MAVKLKIDTTLYNQTSKLILDNVEYVFHVYYNSRIDGWYASFYDPELYSSDQTDNSLALIYGGRRLMPNQDVFGRIKNLPLPKGALVCIDTLLSEYPPKVGKDNFGNGKQYELIYFTEDEL